MYMCMTTQKAEVVGMIKCCGLLHVSQYNS